VTKIVTSFEKDLCGAIIGAIVAGPRGAIVGAFLCHALFSED